MTQINVKNLIETVFIHELGELVISHPYLSFMIMGNGIEFLGTCLYPHNSNIELPSRKCFEYAINNLNSFVEYRQLVGKNCKFDLYKSLRCGLTHSVRPYFPITLSSKSEMPHMNFHTQGNRVNLKCEEFYKDFRNACEELLQITGPTANKLAQPYLNVPNVNYIKFPSSLVQVDKSSASFDASGTSTYP